MITALHGNLGSPADWDAVAEALPEYPLHAVNLWEGEIPFTDRSDSILLDRPVVMGYSLGGRLAMHTFLRGGESPSAGIFISAHPGLASAQERADRLSADRSRAQLLRVDPERFLEQWNAQPVLASSPVSPGQAAVIHQFRHQIASGFETWSLGLQEDLREPLSRCGIPQLWVVGAEDAKYHAVAEEAVAANPHATLRVIPHCGHRVPLQKPRELADCVRTFLETVFRPKSPLEA